MSCFITPPGLRLTATSAFPFVMENSEAFKQYGSLVSTDEYTNMLLRPEGFEITMDLNQSPPIPVPSRVPASEGGCQPLWSSTGLDDTSHGTIYFPGVDEKGNRVFVDYRSKELLLGRSPRGVLSNGEISPYRVQRVDKTSKFVEGVRTDRQGRQLQCFVPLVSSQ